ncbi:energy transducer TonB [Hymenobacter glacialis]|uniref:energy transducer TonB n=1 Tax=Hymenobacter glacialis TaxID=1908236 RepID=UPI0009F1F3A0|nr:energy transducer TonB [Hymenobacter glacialis]
MLPHTPVKALLLCSAWLLACPFAAMSQAVAPDLPALPLLNASFFKADFSTAYADDSTAYCVETTLRDSLSGMMRVYYPSGKLKQFVPYGDVRQRIIYGTLSNWYENGAMRSKEDFVMGKRHGDLLTYYPDGTLKRREQYVHGRGSVGSCYAPDGSPIPYFGYEQLPLYPGGESVLLKEITGGARLNAKETAEMRQEIAQVVTMRHQIWKREVLVELLVAKDGHLADAKIVQSGSSYLGTATLRSVAQLKRQFMPARLDGQAVESRFIVLVSYMLEMPYTPGRSRRPHETAADNYHRPPGLSGQ